MREILFRGKSICADSPTDTSHNYWTEGSLVHQTEHYGDPVNVYHIVKVGNFHSDYYDSEEVWPETVGQYIGLNDRDGRKIFEGDILESPIKHVGQKYGKLIVVTDVIKYMHMILYMKDCRVIGNIHDNPELLAEPKMFNVESNMIPREEYEALFKRFRHLLQSDFIRSFDEHDPRTHTYARNISDADKIVNEVK